MLKQRGISLLENVIALLILAFAFLGILKYSLSQQAYALENNTRSSFVSSTRSLLALLKADPSQIACIISNPPPSLPPCSQISPNISQTLSLISSTPSYHSHSISWDPSYNAIRITIQWSRKSKDVPLGTISLLSSP